jgi:hypothetical protein
MHTRRSSPLAALTLFCAVGWTLLGPSVASAGSAVVLPYPDYFGEIPAAAYNKSGARVGSALLKLERLPDGLVVMSVETEVEDGARTEARAELSVLEDNRGLRLLREFSHSHNQQGKSMGILRVDHVKGEATCTPTPTSGTTASRVTLPLDDRVTNVPLNLLFLPLVQGETDRISFQLFLCGGGAKVVDFSATAKAHANDGPHEGPHDIVEVRYVPELGAVMSFLAKAVVPDLAFWFDSNGQGTYLAHRMPLFSKGPEVTVIRDGIAQELITAKP